MDVCMGGAMGCSVTYMGWVIYESTSLNIPDV